MILIVAVDDRLGMMFNKRRQSRDRILCGKILDLASDNILWMNEYTAKLFAEMEANGEIVADEDFTSKTANGEIVVDEHFLTKAAREDFCFAENVLPREEDVDKIIMFKWNRKYPGDFYFDMNISSWNMTETEEFVGSSHENITMEVYER